MPPRGNDNNKDRKGGKGRRDSRGPREVREFEEHMLQLDRVTRVVKGGRRMRFRASAIIGDHAGRVGFGLGKGNDVQVAMRKAVHDAKKNIITVPIVNGTITHDADVKFKAAKLMVMPASEGTGVIAGGAIRKIMELAGVKNILSKNFGTNNRVVVAQAVMKMLRTLRMTEAAKKYVAELKKVRDEAKKKEAAERAAQDAAGRDGRGPRRGDRSAPRAMGDMTKTDMQAAVEKMQETKGRLEEESGK